MNEATFNELILTLPMRRISSAALDSELSASPASLDILFLWGRDCVNCEVAKAAMLAASRRLQWPDVRWFHANVYNDPELGVRFGLHGVPVFFVYRQGRKLGRISEWPGLDSFVDAIEKLRHTDC